MDQAFDFIIEWVAGIGPVTDGAAVFYGNEIASL